MNKYYEQAERHLRAIDRFDGSILNQIDKIGSIPDFKTDKGIKYKAKSKKEERTYVKAEYFPDLRDDSQDKMRQIDRNIDQMSILLDRLDDRARKIGEDLEEHNQDLDSLQKSMDKATYKAKNLSRKTREINMK